MSEREPGINPYDGYRVSIEDDPYDKVVRLYVEVRLNGEQAMSPVCVATVPSDGEGQGEVLRLSDFLRSLCRYANSGGDLQVLMRFLASDALDALVQFKFSIPEHLQLVSHTDTDAGFQYIFHNMVRDTYLVVTEDCYAEELEADELWGSLVDDYHERHFA